MRERNRYNEITSNDLPGLHEVAQIDLVSDKTENSMYCQNGANYSKSL
jgi:hypothetical protein